MTLTVGKRLVVILGLIVVSGCTSIERLSLPEPALADIYWARHDAASAAVIDHRLWQSFLDRYVSTDAAGVNLVNYAAVSPQDHALLKRYLAELQAVSIHQHRRDVQLAYWVNLYNAKTVDIVLDHYPVDSIRDIKLGDGLIVVGPWRAPVLRVSGRPLSLNDIEHAIIRPIWQDQRIHYVLNCAAIGCPNLGLKAYGNDDIDAAMTVAAEAYVNDPRGVHVDGNGRLRLSKIYAWFREDFGGEPRAVLHSVAQFAKPSLRARLEEHGRIDDYAYNWLLNDSRRAVVPLKARRVRPDGRVRQGVWHATDLSVASTANSQGWRHQD